MSERKLKIWVGVLTVLVILLLLMDVVAVVTLMKVKKNAASSLDEVIANLEKQKNHEIEFQLPSTLRIPVKNISKPVTIPIDKTVHVPINEDIPIEYHAEKSIRITDVVPVHIVQNVTATGYDSHGNKINITVPLDVWVDAPINTTVMVPIDIKTTAHFEKTIDVPIQGSFELRLDQVLGIENDTLVIHLPSNYTTIRLTPEQLGLDSLIDQLVETLKAIRDSLG